MTTVKETCDKLTELRQLYATLNRSYAMNACPLVRINLRHTLKRIYLLEDRLQNMECDDAYDQNTGKLNTTYKIS